MDLIDTPNPNAKKILIDHDYEIATYINKETVDHGGVARLLIEINGIDSVFAGPGFLTVTREENFSWESINNDILNKFDTI